MGGGETPPNLGVPPNSFPGFWGGGAREPGVPTAYWALGGPENGIPGGAPPGPIFLWLAPFFGGPGLGESGPLGIFFQPGFPFGWGLFGPFSPAKATPGVSPTLGGIARILAENF